MLSRLVVLSVTTLMAVLSTTDLCAAEKKDAPAVIAYPDEGGKVARKDQIDGRLSGKGGWPVALIQPLIANEPWYVQPPVSNLERRESSVQSFTAEAYFGDASTPPRTRFRVVILVVGNRNEAYEKFKEGAKVKTLPAGVPRSKYVTVIRE